MKALELYFSNGNGTVVIVSVVIIVSSVIDPPRSESRVLTRTVSKGSSEEV